MATIQENELVLESYIDDLLTPSSEQVTTNKSNVSTLSVVRPIKQEDKKEDVISEPAIVETEDEPVKKETISYVKPVHAPEWVEASFKAHVCLVNNMKLAIPSFMVKEIINYTDELKAASNSPEWVLGLNVSEETFVAVIDTAHLLLNKPNNSINKVILLNASRWGLAVEDVSASDELNSADIHWRKESSTRPWLIGTNPEKGVAIVDTNKIFDDVQ